MTQYTNFEKLLYIYESRVIITALARLRPHDPGRLRGFVCPPQAFARLRPL
jgi:hypothetical protein